MVGLAPIERVWVLLKVNPVPIALELVIVKSVLVRRKPEVSRQVFVEKTSDPLKVVGLTTD